MNKSRLDEIRARVEKVMMVRDNLLDGTRPDMETLCREDVPMLMSYITKLESVVEAGRELNKEISHRRLDYSSHQDMFESALTALDAPIKEDK